MKYITLPSKFKIIEDYSNIKLFEICYFLFLSGQFFLPVHQNALFAVLILLPFIVLFSFKKSRGVLFENYSESISAIRNILFRKNILLILIFFTFSFFHSIFIALNFDDIAKNLAIVLSTLVFLISSLLYFSLEDRRYELSLLLKIIAISVIISLYINYDPEARFHGLGKQDNPIIVGGIYSMFSMIALYLVVINFKKEMLINIAIMILLGIAIFVTKSRGPIITYLVCLPFSLILYKHYKHTVYLLLLLISIVVFSYIFDDYFYSNPIMRYIDGLIERKDSLRFEVWSIALSEIKEKPFFGHGIHAIFGDGTYFHPHNIILGTVFYIGIVGGILLFSSFSYALYSIIRLLRGDSMALTIILFSNGFLLGMTDFAKIFSNGYGLWLVYWLPLAVALSFFIRAGLWEKGREA